VTTCAQFSLHSKHCSTTPFRRNSRFDARIGPKTRADSHHLSHPPSSAISRPREFPSNFRRPSPDCVPDLPSIAELLGTDCCL
jgi:hypothetical protein